MGAEADVCLGIPFNDTNWRLAIAEYGQSILGDKLVGMQAGNEPDLYQRCVFFLNRVFLVLIML